MNCNDNTIYQIASLNLDGNIIPHAWYSTITFANGKPHLPAIIILAEILFWYRPEAIKDEVTGKFLGYRKKFKSDLLQRSYKSFEDQFGFSKKQIKTALVKLEELGLIRRVFRDIEIENGAKLTNVMYIQIFPEQIKKITYDKFFEKTKETLKNPVNSTQGHTYGHTGTEVCTSMSTGYGHTGTEGMDIEGHTYTEITITEITNTENIYTTAPNEKKSFGAEENTQAQNQKLKNSYESSERGGLNNPPEKVSAGNRENKCSTTKLLKQSEKINFNFETLEWEMITASDIEGWQKAYPACDISVELEKMKQWLIANPDKRKKNYRRFIVNWLTRQQDKGGTRAIVTSSKSNAYEEFLQKYSATTDSEVNHA